MDPIYAGSTIRQTYIMLGTMLKAAKMNDLIAKHPLDTVRFTKTVRAANDIQFFTRDEQRLFLEMAQHTLYYKQYVLLLDTGLRTGELTGMTWDVIDFDKKNDYSKQNIGISVRGKILESRTAQNASKLSYNPFNW